MLTYLFCRTRYSPLASILAAIAFGFSTWMMTWLQFPIAAGAAFLPGVLLVIDRLMHGITRPRFLAATLMFAVAVLSSHPETVYHVALIAAAYGLWLGLVSPERQARRTPVPCSVFLVPCSAVSARSRRAAVCHAARRAVPRPVRRGGAPLAAVRGDARAARSHRAALLRFSVRRSAAAPRFLGELRSNGRGDRPAGVRMRLRRHPGHRGHDRRGDLPHHAPPLARPRDALHPRCDFLRRRRSRLAHDHGAVPRPGRARTDDAHAPRHLLVRQRAPASVVDEARRNIRLPLLIATLVVSAAMLALMRTTAFPTPSHRDTALLSLLPSIAVLAAVALFPARRIVLVLFAALTFAS